MIDRLVLATGVDIPLSEVQLVVHQPTLKELGMIQEHILFYGLDLLTITADKIQTVDKIDLANQSNFDIFMMIMQNNNVFINQQQIEAVTLVLTLLFPQYQFYFIENGLMFQKDTEEPKIISSANFDELQEVIEAIFCLSDASGKQEYNPSGPKARALVEKFKKRHEQLKEGVEDFSLYDKLLSIVSVGLQIPVNTLTNCTPYQLKELMFSRMMKKTAWDNYLNAKIQGASGMDEPEFWFNDLYSNK